MKTTLRSHARNDAGILVELLARPDSALVRFLQRSLPPPTRTARSIRALTGALSPLGHGSPVATLAGIAGGTVRCGRIQLGDDDLRIVAVSTLRYVRARPAFVDLFDLLDHRNGNVVRAVADALVRLRVDEAIPRMMARLQQERDAATAIRVLHALRAREALPLLMARLDSSSAEEAFWDLAGGEATGLLVEVVRSGPELRIDAAARSLSKHAGEATLASLRAIVDDAGALARGRARALEAQDEAGSHAWIDTAVAWMGGSDEELAAWAFDLFLTRGLRQELIEPLRRLFETGHERARIRAALALGDQGDGSVGPFLLDLLASERWGRFAEQSVLRLRDPSMIPLLLERARLDPPGARSVAIEALAATATKAPAAVCGAFAALLDEADADRALAILAALRGLVMNQGTQFLERGLVERVVALLDRPEPRVLCAAIDLLDFNCVRDAAAAIERLAAHPDRAVREAAEHARRLR